MFTFYFMFRLTFHIILSFIFLIGKSLIITFSAWSPLKGSSRTKELIKQPSNSNPLKYKILDISYISAVTNRFKFTVMQII